MAEPGRLMRRHPVAGLALGRALIEFWALDNWEAFEQLEVAVLAVPNTIPELNSETPSKAPQKARSA